jgi:hypothetical protein
MVTMTLCKKEKTLHWPFGHKEKLISSNPRGTEGTLFRAPLEITMWSPPKKATTLSWERERSTLENEFLLIIPPE